MGSEVAKAKSFELVEYENGSFTLRERSSGQSMHSRVGPWAEAQQVYIEQSGLSLGLRGLRGGEQVVFDVGMGLAANALAALELWEGLADAGCEVTPLRVVSFESRPEGLQAALGLAEADPKTFDFIARNQSRVKKLLADGKWTSQCGRARWELYVGDFREFMGSASFLQAVPTARFVFYDFYDPKVCPDLWTPQLFDQLRQKCAQDAVLCTYAAATPVRTALLLAGFRVGKGHRTWAKAETTVAIPIESDRSLGEPLGLWWLEKWEKSSRPFPYGGEYTDRESLRRVLVAHPQFKTVSQPI